MKKIIGILLIGIIAVLLMSCGEQPLKTPSADQVQAKQTEQMVNEGNKQVGMPAITNFTDKKVLKWIYELCDQENLVCHAYLFNVMKGEVGQYLGQCIGYGVPYSTQFSNPEKYGQVDGGEYGAINPYTMPQAEPNGLFKPEGLSATWLVMLDPADGTPRPVYVEPEIIVSPFKLR